PPPLPPLLSPDLICTLFPYTTLFRSNQRDFFGSHTPLCSQIVIGAIGLHCIKGCLNCIKHGSITFTHGNAFNRSINHGATNIKLDRKSTRLNSSHLGISYAVFCLKKK